MPKQQTNAWQLRLKAMGTGRDLDGLWVESWEHAPYPGLYRVENALRLIKQHSPFHYSRVVRDLKRVRVFLSPVGLAEYDHSSNTCVLDERYVGNLTTTLEQIASTIIHEATHARLNRWGVKYDEGQRSRVEAICFRRELAFAVRLPNSAPLQEELKRYVEWYAANPNYFSTSNFRERTNLGLAETFRHMGAPEWFIRAVPAVRSAVSMVRRLFHNSNG